MPIKHLRNALINISVSFEIRISDKEKRNDRLSDDESMKACLEEID